jgi:hypothetical protein
MMALFAGYIERESLENCVEYLLVLSYAPNGALQDYLRTNVLDWPTFCKMSLSVARGLAHLHTDVRKGGKLNYTYHYYYYYLIEQQIVFF